MENPTSFQETSHDMIFFIDGLSPNQKFVNKIGNNGGSNTYQ